jgi:Lon protease-like protein
MVLFPGASAPLHIFEPRYRRMLDDCMQGDHRFGLICLPAGMAERDLARGRVGTIARIDDAETLPDGRSNIAVTGEERFAFDQFVESEAPYHVAATTQYDDFPEPSGELDEAAAEIQEQFERVARAARALADDVAPPPALPDDPSRMAFAIAAMVDLTTDQRQKLLESRSPLNRMRDVGAILDVAAVPMERHAEVHRRARQNGRGTLEAT